MGVAYNTATFNVAVIIQGKMSQLRGSNKGNWYDTILMLLDQSGDVERAATISQGTLGTVGSMYTAENGILNVAGTYEDENYYFSGWSKGYETKYQKLNWETFPDIKEKSAEDADSYVYKYDFKDSKTKHCLYEEEISRGDARRRITKTSTSSIDSSQSNKESGLEKILTLWDSNEDVKKELKQNYFIPYVSRYSGGFALIDTMKIPRPCAFESYNLTSVEYYRGQNTMFYNIGD